MKRFIVSTLVLISVLAAVASAPWTARVHAVTNYYVSPSGSDSNSGTSASAPFATLQKALDVAGPGDVINLAAGAYLQDAVSRRDGSASAPISITGPATAVIKGGGAARVLQIHHDHHILDGFTIDGLHGDPNSMSGYRDKLLYVIGVEPLNGVTGLKVRNMTFKNGGGECLRMRYFAQHNEVANSTFQNCGVHDFWFNAGGKNGEAIYIGTAPEQWGMNGAPTADADQSNHNWVHHNVINTQGNECVDIKEASSFNIVEHNDCTGQRDPNSAGLDSRGNANTFRFNKSYGNTGAGIRFGGDTASDGIDNDAYGNEIFDNAAGGIKFMRTPQGKVCGNSMYNNTGGNSVGTYASEFDPTAPCPDEPTPTSGTAPTATPTTPPAGSSKLAVAAVSASSHDGNVPENTLDGSLSTRWSAEGDGQWIKYDLGASKTVDLLKIAFHRGDVRVASFDIELSSDNVSWTRVFSGQSSGTTLQLQTFDFGNSAARWVRIVGHGNTENAWNSLAEVEIWGSDG